MACLYRVLSKSGLSLKGQLPGEAITLGEALMAPTIIYVKQVIHHPAMFTLSCSMLSCSLDE